MLMNNGPNTRSYSPAAVPTASQQRTDTSKDDPKERLKSLVKDQIACEIKAAMIYAELAEAYWKMGLLAHFILMSQ